MDLPSSQNTLSYGGVVLAGALAGYAAGLAVYEVMTAATASLEIAMPPAAERTDPVMAAMNVAFFVSCAVMVLGFAILYAIERANRAR